MHAPKTNDDLVFTDDNNGNRKHDFDWTGKSTAYYTKFSKMNVCFNICEVWGHAFYVYTIGTSFYSHFQMQFREMNLNLIYFILEMFNSLLIFPAFSSF